MEFAIVFLAFVLAAAAILFLFNAFNILFDPFGGTQARIVGAALLFLLTPLFAAGSFTAFIGYLNYCPPLVPIAAPDFADNEPRPPLLFDGELLNINRGLAQHLHHVKTQLAAKTIELDAASRRVRELEAASKAQKDFTLAVDQTQNSERATVTESRGQTPVQRVRQRCNRIGGCN